MIRFILSVFTLTVVCGVVASAQPPQDPNQIKGCARTMTNDMRNCGGQQPQVREKSKSGSESAQGFKEEQQSCNQQSLYSYYECFFGGWGVAKPVPVVPAVTKVPAKAKPTPKATTAKIKN